MAEVVVIAAVAVAEVADIAVVAVAEVVDIVAAVAETEDPALADQETGVINSLANFIHKSSLLSAEAFYFFNFSSR